MLYTMNTRGFKKFQEIALWRTTLLYYYYRILTTILCVIIWVLYMWVVRNKLEILSLWVEFWCGFKRQTKYFSLYVPGKILNGLSIGYKLLKPNNVNCFYSCRQTPVDLHLVLLT